jgi:effector-binding domain-containing protein
MLPGPMGALRPGSRTVLARGSVLPALIAWAAIGILGISSVFADIEETGTAAMADSPTRVLLKHTEPKNVAAMSHTGPFDDIPAVVMGLMGQVGMEGYAMTGPLMIVYYDNPDEVPAEDLRWEVWMPVAYPGPMKTGEDGELGFRHVDPMFVAYTFHIGPYEKLSEAYGVLMDWAGRNDYEIVGPPVEVNWSDPMTVPEEKLVTEIWFPVKEKKVPGIAK